MNSHARLCVKAISWQFLGLISMTLVGYVTTGSLSAGGTIAGISCAIGFACFFLHEKLWDAIPWGRQSARRRPER